MNRKEWAKREVEIVCKRETSNKKKKKVNLTMVVLVMKVL